MTDPVAVDITSPPFQLPEGVADGMYQKLMPADVTDFTTGALAGNGVFDKMMATLSVQLQAQADRGLITGSEYAKAYIQLAQIAMQTALQFSLQADTSYWQNQTAQIAAITARIEMEKVRYEYLAAQYNMTTLLPLQSAGLTLDNTGKTTANSIAAYQLSTVLPGQVAVTASQKTLLDSQNAGELLKNTGQGVENSILSYNLATVLPGQVALTASQKAVADSQVSAANYTLANILPEQKTLVHEQAEVQNAQTSDVALDGVTPIKGLIGQQKLLYAQQVTSYQRDAEVKAAKLFSDAWTVQKTMDEGLLAPNGFTNTSVDTVLTKIKTNNGFV